MSGLYQLIAVVGLVLLARTRRSGVCPHHAASQFAQTQLRVTRGLPSSLCAFPTLSGPGVAGCLGNGSMLARGGSLMERLWIREVRRAARRARTPFARQMVWGCGAAAVGTMVASLLPLQLDGAVAKAVWAALWAVAAYVAIL
jgi:hypothetical protein